MGDTTGQGFSLTPDEEKFFVRFLRHRALPWSAMVSAVAGGLTAAVLTCSIGGLGATPDTEAPLPLEAPGLAPPLADEHARAELAALRKELAELRAQPASPSAGPDASSAADDAQIAELRRSLESLKRELQTMATSVTELQRRATGDSTPAAPDAAAAAELEPMRKRIQGVEERQDREETARLAWAGNVEQRVRNLEHARRARESDHDAVLQGILDRLHALEQGIPRQ